MYSLKGVAAALYVNAAIGAGMLCTGQLQGRVVGAPSAEGARSWLLRGQILFRMFELHQAGVQMQHASGITCAGGIKHLVLRQRLGKWEHRFVIQLLGPTMREFIAQGAQSQRGVQLVLENNLLPGLACASAPLECLRDLSSQDVVAVPARPDAALAALLEVASHCLGLNPEGMSSSPPLEHVCVSLVLAPEYEALARSRAGRHEKAAAA